MAGFRKTLISQLRCESVLLMPKQHYLSSLAKKVTRVWIHNKMQEEENTDAMKLAKVDSVISAGCSVDRARG